MASLNPPLEPPQHHHEHHQGSGGGGGGVGGGERETQLMIRQLCTAYLGVSFAVFLSLFPTLRSRNRYLMVRLRKAEEELTELRSRRQEDSKANARVVEIFATHRNSWQQEERRLLRRLDDSSEEISRLRSRLAELESREGQLLGEVEELRREVGERDELLNFMSRHKAADGGGDGGEDYASVSGEEREWGGDSDGGGANSVFGNLGSDYNDGFDNNFLSSSSKFWPDRPNFWQDTQYETVEPMQHAKNYVARRESPWKVDGESSGVPSKLKLLEEELLNLEKVGKNNSTKVASLMRKQTKRYQDLTGKIEDLCKRMQASDPSETALNSEFRSQRQTEFLLEAFQLQQRATETGKKLLSLQTDIYSHSLGDELETRLAVRRSLDSIRSNFKEIQRNLEIWLARIMGDLEGILARDGATRARDYYFPRYPYPNSFN